MIIITMVLSMNDASRTHRDRVWLVPAPRGASRRAFSATWSPRARAFARVDARAWTNGVESLRRRVPKMKPRRRFRSRFSPSKRRRSAHNAVWLHI